MSPCSGYPAVSGRTTKWRTSQPPAPPAQHGYRRGRSRAASSGGAGSGSPWYPFTVPNLPLAHSSAAAVISSGLRATKFHHISSCSPSGTPPSRKQEDRASGGSGHRHLLPAGAQVEQLPGAQRGSLHLSRPCGGEQHVLMRRRERDPSGRASPGGIPAGDELRADDLREHCGRRRGARQRAEEDGDFESADADDGSCA